jgi:hypothetical protein
MTKVIYIIYNEHTKLIKIGVSANVLQRIKKLESVCGVDLQILFTSPPIKEAQKLETHIHGVFNPYRKRGEWFSVSYEDVIPEINKLFLVRKPAVDQRYILYKENKSISEIAKHYNVSKQAISKLISGWHIKPSTFNVVDSPNIVDVPVIPAETPKQFTSKFTKEQLEAMVQAAKNKHVKK